MTEKTLGIYLRILGVELDSPVSPENRRDYEQLLMDTAKEKFRATESPEPDESPSSEEEQEEEVLQKRVEMYSPFTDVSNEDLSSIKLGDWPREITQEEFDELLKANQVKPGQDDSQ